MIYGMGLLGCAWSWLLPGHYFPWSSFQQEVFAAVGAALVAVATLASTGNRALLWPRLTMATALLAVVPLIQWRMGMIPFFADALLPALYLLAFSLARDRWRGSLRSQGPALRRRLVRLLSRRRDRLHWATAGRCRPVRRTTWDRISRKRSTSPSRTR